MSRPKIGLHKKTELRKKAVNLFQDYLNGNVCSIIFSVLPCNGLKSLTKFKKLVRFNNKIIES